MTTTVNGFISIPVLSNNVPTEVAILGELSEISRTFCKEKGIHFDPNHSDVQLTTFHCREVATGDLVEAPAPFVSLGIRLYAYMYEQATQGTLGGTGPEIAVQLNAEFNGEIDDLQLGPLRSNGTIALPSYVGCSIIGEGASNFLKVWVSNADFQVEYPEYEIIVIPPLPNLNILFQDFNTVKAAIAARTFAQLTADIQAQTGVYPATEIRTEVYNDMIGPDPLQYVPTSWTVVIYGIAGSNIDLIKEAIIQYALENSDFDREEWTVRFPSLFISTEFVIVPHWDKLSVQNLNDEARLYSPIFSTAQIYGYIEDLPIDYPTVHKEATVRGSVLTYKSASFSIVGNPENIDGEYIFEEKFPDYIVVSPQSGDFGRMSPETQRWSNLINAMMPTAEAMMLGSIIPSQVAGYSLSRITRNSVVYLAASVDGVLYLILPRYLGIQ